MAGYHTSIPEEIVAPGGLKRGLNDKKYKKNPSIYIFLQNYLHKSKKQTIFAVS
jgi:hypothetical protein